MIIYCIISGVKEVEEEVEDADIDVLAIEDMSEAYTVE